MKCSGRSIQRSLIQVIVWILLLLGLVFFFSFSTVHDLGRGQSRFTKEMNQLQRSISLISSLNTLNAASIARGGFTVEHLQTNNEIREVLFTVGKVLSSSDESLFYYRTLLAMLDYYESETDRLLHGRVSAEEVFQIRTYLRNLHPYIIRHAQQLTISIMAVETGRQTERIQVVNRSIVRSFVLVLVVEIVGLVIIFSLIRRIYATIHHVATHAGGLARHEWDLPDLQHYGYSDLRPVVNAFNEMKHSIAAHIAEIEEKRRLETALNRQSLELLEQGKLLRESQLFALQSQMNPHFLFNTLNVIAKTALKREPDETVELIQAMSKILRFNLENIRRLVPLDDEIKSVEAYILIQRRRFAGELDISMEIGTDVPLDIRVPPMIIQPIIENAILHGLEGKLFNRRISVCISAVAGKVMIMTEDNGKGIAAEKIRELLAINENGATETNTLGIKSVTRRIALAYQGRGCVAIESKPGLYTRVCIELPTAIKERNNV